MSSFATDYLPSNRMEHHFTLDGRQIVAQTARYGERLYVERISQVVSRPRAYGKVLRKLWPKAKPNSIALAALARLGATPSGFISVDPATQDLHGDSRPLSASELRGL